MEDLRSHHRPTRRRFWRTHLGLPRAFAARPIQGSRDGQDVGISDQQHQLATADHRRAIQESLAGGIVLQMDQATSAHQAFFGHQRERGEDANLVRRLHLRADCHRQKGASPQCLALLFVTDIVGVSFRENPYFMRLAARCQQSQRTTFRQPIDSV